MDSYWDGGAIDIIQPPLADAVINIMERFGYGQSLSLTLGQSPSSVVSSAKEH